MNNIEIRPETRPRAVRATNDDQFVRLFLQNKCSDSEATLRTYTKAVEQFFVFTDSAPLNEITLEVLEDYKAHLREVYTSEHTRKLKMNVVKSLLTFGATTLYLPFNVGAAVKADKAESVLEDKVISQDVLSSLIARLDTSAEDNRRRRTGARDALLVRLLYSSGCRVSEIAALTWSDVQDDYIIIRKGKGNKRRNVVLSNATMGKLKAFKPVEADKDDPIFTKVYRGKVEPMGVNAIFKQVQRIGDRYGIDNLHPHRFRHSHGTHALEKGADIAMVKDTLGHASIATTNAYIHPDKNRSSSVVLGV